MQAIRELRDKIINMADEAGGDDHLESLDANYYEQSIVADCRAGRDVSVTEAIEAVTWLRQVINSQEASA